jgi:hypothetical protein
VPEQIGVLRTALKQAQDAGDAKAEAKIHGALERIGYHEPGIVGGNVLAQGKVLRPRYSAELERVGGALSVAKDRLVRIEQKHVERYGFVPEKSEAGIVGGENAGAGAAYVGDRPNAVSRGLARAGGVTGKRTKLGYERQSTGALFGQGRASRSSKNVLADYMQTAKSVARGRNVEKAASFSKPLNPDGSLSAGHRYFNPEGVKVPPVLKGSEEELGQMLPQEMLQAARAEHDRYVRDVFPTDRTNPTLVGSAAFRRAVAEGRVRQIPERVAAAFENAHDLPMGFTEARGLKPLLALLDTGNELTKAGLLYLKGSFVCRRTSPATRSSASSSRARGSSRTSSAQQHTSATSRRRTCAGSTARSDRAHHCRWSSATAGRSAPSRTSSARHPTCSPIGCPAGRR